MAYILSAIIGYLLGCSSMSYYIGRFKKINIKEQGSKNYGASNTVLLIGKRAGLAVFIHDFLKAVIAVFLASWLFPTAEYAGVVAGCASIVGHIFPFYLKFDGGKGFASFIGMSFALFPMFALVVFIVAFLLALVIDYIVVATFIFITAVPIIALWQGEYLKALIIFSITLLIFFKHRENIKNLITRNGKESRIRSALSKKKRGTDEA